MDDGLLGDIRNKIRAAGEDLRENRLRRLAHWCNTCDNCDLAGPVQDTPMSFLASDDSSFITASSFLVDGPISGAYVTPL